MKKTKFENFIEKNNLFAEIELTANMVKVLIYKETDLYLYTQQGKTMNEAIEKAVNHYMQRESKC